MTIPRPVDYWKSERSLAFARLSDAGGITPAAAVDLVRSFDQERGLAGPTIYVSTAITSGGYKRHPDLQGDEKTPEIIRANNQASGLLMGALAESRGVVTAENAMVPTEIGKVLWPGGERKWLDTDYMIFYFAYAAGLSTQAAQRLTDYFAVSAYADILARANDRKIRDNELRWPSYSAFVDIALGKTAALTRTSGSQIHEPFSVMLQLVDVEMSLGCRAEEHYARFFGLDLLVPAVNSALIPADDPLRHEIDALTAIQAGVGVAAQGVMAVADELNPEPQPV